MIFDSSPDKISFTETPADKWDRETTKRALDELFKLTTQYRSSKNYYDLLKFIKKFRRYSAFNTMLVHIQMPGAKFFAPASQWFNQYGRTIKPGERPMVILKPMGPVMFVFDVSQTEGKLLPDGIEKPFEVENGELKDQFEKTIMNCARDGIAVHNVRAGSQWAGCIKTVEHSGKFVKFKDKNITVRYDVQLNEKASKESKYTTLVHELAHLYCGHLGTPNEKWWPHRLGLDHGTREFEAESITYMVCTRQGLSVESEKYLNEYTREHEQVPGNISFECVMKTANLIEKMGSENFKARKEPYNVT